MTSHTVAYRTDSRHVDAIQQSVTVVKALSETATTNTITTTTTVVVVVAMTTNVSSTFTDNSISSEAVYTDTHITADVIVTASVVVAVHPAKLTFINVYRYYISNSHLVPSLCYVHTDIISW